MKILLSLLLIGLLMFAASCSNTTSSTTNPSIAGNWASTVNVTGGSGTITLNNLTVTLGVVYGTGNIAGTSTVGGTFSQPIPAFTGTYNYPNVYLNFLADTYSGSMCSCGLNFSGVLDSASFDGITIPMQSLQFTKQWFKNIL